MNHKFLLLSLSALSLVQVQAFSSTLRTTTRATKTRLASSPSNPIEKLSEEQELNLQWDLFRKHHAVKDNDSSASWKGIWTTYDYIGDVVDETVAAINYKSPPDDDAIVQQTHAVVAGAKRSDCATCFDSMEIKEFPVKSYNRNDPTQTVFQKSRLAANAMVNGPTLLRSGVMATELILSYGDGRVRVTFQHAPVWAAGVEPGSGPPQGLKLVRTMISREALRSTAPTAETEAADPPAPGNPIFYRPVPPFNWHKKWAGTSWTWGPTSGDRGWAMDNLEEEDAWQGISTVERWNLRLPGGVFVQAPRVITDMQAELCRMAWLPDDDTLLRVEAGCLALQPMLMDDDQLVGFHPPSLASLRTDVLKKMGDLDQVPSFVRDQQGGTNELAKPLAEDEPKSEGASAAAAAVAEALKPKKAATKPPVADKAPPAEESKKTQYAPKKNPDDGSEDVRDVLSL